MSSAPCTNPELYPLLARMMMYSLNFLGCDHCSIFLVVEAYGYRGDLESVRRATQNQCGDFKDELEPYRVTPPEQKNEIVFECETLPEVHVGKAKLVIVENARGRMVKIISTAGKLSARFAD